MLPGPAVGLELRVRGILRTELALGEINASFGGILGEGRYNQTADVT